MPSRRPQLDFAALDPEDRRSTMRTITPQSGLTLRQAMVHYGDQATAARFLLSDHRYRGLLRTPADRHSVEFSISGRSHLSALENLQRALLDKLAAGELRATGFDATRGIDERAQAIPPDRWRTLKPDFDASSASSPGVEISGVLVFKTRPQHVEAAMRPPASQRRVREWYQKRVADAVAAGVKHTRDDDEAAARLEFGVASRSLIRPLRQSFAPPEWSRGGRPKEDK